MTTTHSLLLLILISWCALTVGASLAGALLKVTTARVSTVAMAATLWFMLGVLHNTAAAGEPVLSPAQSLAGAVVMAAVVWYAGGRLASLTLRSGDRSAMAAAFGESHALRREVALFPRTRADGAITEVESRAFVGSLLDSLDQFDDWLDRFAAQEPAQAWSAFGEFIRALLRQTCGAGHVRIYQVNPGDDELVPLDMPTTNQPPRKVPVRSGIVGHVVTSGTSYLAGDPLQGGLVSQLAGAQGEHCAWCFGITGEGGSLPHHGGASAPPSSAAYAERLGVVVVGHLLGAPLRDRTILRCIEKVVSQMWRTLYEMQKSSVAATRDPASGLLNRETFLRVAAQKLNESYSAGEPVALAVLAVEGLRALDDHGRWNNVTQVVRHIASRLRQKVRSDDVLGRFDDSRFLILLRRVDTALAELIVKQIVQKVGMMPARSGVSWPMDHAPQGFAREQLDVRCGLAGSGVGQPGLDELLERAIENGHQARRLDRDLVSDLGLEWVKG